MTNKILPKFVFCLSILIVSISGCSSEPQYEKQPTKTAAVEQTHKPLTTVRIAVNSTIKSASIILAFEKGFFKDQGLQVKLLVKKTGVAAHKAMLNRDADLATVPESLAAYDTLKHDNWQIITSVNRSDTNVIVGRKDHGISDISSLKGKKIGLKLKSGSAYWLSRLLTYNSLFNDDVTLVDGQPGALVQMIENGKTDAVITWHPHAYKIQQALGSNAVSFAAQQGQDMYWVLLARRDWISQNQQTSIAVLKALSTSAQYIRDNQHDAKTAIAKYLQLKPNYVDFEWPLHSFVNELSQNLLQSMEEELQWKLGQLKEPQLRPDLSSYIYTDALTTVDHDAVGIIR